MLDSRVSFVNYADWVLQFQFSIFAKCEPLLPATNIRNWLRKSASSELARTQSLYAAEFFKTLRKFPVINNEIIICKMYFIGTTQQGSVYLSSSLWFYPFSAHSITLESAGMRRRCLPTFFLINIFAPSSILIIITRIVQVEDLSKKLIVSVWILKFSKF